MLQQLKKQGTLVAFVASSLITVSISASAESIVQPAEWPKNVPVPKAEGHSSEVSGGAPSDEQRVVGISFKDRLGVQRICSGLFIAKGYVLTAAHCTCHENPYLITNLKFIDHKWRRATLHRRFPGYNCAKGPTAGDDLALLVIRRNLSIANGLKVCSAYSLLQNIPPTANLIKFPPRRVTVAGYGFEGDRPDSWGLRRAASVAPNTYSCHEPLATALGCSPLREFILGAARTDGELRDTCAGDSGGPVYLKSNGGMQPIGIVSRGLPIRQVFGVRGKCGSGGIYTHLGRKDVLEWLQDNGVPEGVENCN